MNRFCCIFLLLACFVVLCCDCCGNLSGLGGRLSGPELAKKANNATAALVFTNMEGHTKVFCSAVWVDKDILMTANHCVQGLSEKINEENEAKNAGHLLQRIVSGSDEGVEADFPPVSPQDLTVPYITSEEVVGVGKNPSAIHTSTARVLFVTADIALLYADNPQSVPAHGIARLADKEPEQGETLGVMGHTVGMYFSYLPATVAGYRKSLPGENDIEGPYMQLSTAAYFGNSGGGAWNSSGELCGIASFLTDKAPLMVFYIPQKTLAGIMRGAKIIPTTIDTTQPDPSLD